MIDEEKPDIAQIESFIRVLCGEKVFISKFPCDKEEMYEKFDKIKTKKQLRYFNYLLLNNKWIKLLPILHEQLGLKLI